MMQAKFHTGQRVYVTRSTALSGPPGTYKIVNPLPIERSGRQYRVRKDGETFDRILDEERISAFDHE